MQCSLCNKLVLPTKTSSARVFIGNPQDLVNIAVQCNDCGLIFCGECASHNVESFGGDMEVPKCTECSGLLAPREED